jgi:hypothetical protein
MLENNILLIIFGGLAFIPCINKYAVCLWAGMWEVEKNACPNGTGRPAGMLQARIIWLVCPCAKAGVVH